MPPEQSREVNATAGADPSTDLLSSCRSAQAVRNTAEIEAVLDAQARAPNGGVIVLASPLVETDRKQIIALAAEHRLPAIYHFREYVEDGGLAAYGAELFDLYRRAATYVDRVLKGNKPSDLPIQFATKIELAINLKRARATPLRAASSSGSTPRAGTSPASPPTKPSLAGK